MCGDISLSGLDLVTSDDSTRLFAGFQSEMLGKYSWHIQQGNRVLQVKSHDQTPALNQTHLHLQNRNVVMLPEFNKKNNKNNKK